jgi:phage terminase small subunit
VGTKKKQKPHKRGDDRKQVVMPARERAFVDAFFLTWNAEAAAKKAGVRAKSPHTAWQFLKRPNVQRMIQEEIDARAKAAGVSADKIVSIIYNIANAAFKDFASWDENDLRLVSSKDMTRDQSRAIKSIEVRTNNAGHVSRKITLHDPLRACELLARIKKMISPSDHDGGKGAQELAGMVRRALAENDDKSGGGANGKPLARKVTAPKSAKTAEGKATGKEK